MTGVEVRLAASADADALALVGAATFLETFAGVLGGADIVRHCADQHQPALYRRWLEDDASRLWIVETERGRAPVGYLVLRPAEIEAVELVPGDLEIKRVYLLSRFQGLGVGAALMERAVEAARSMGARRIVLGAYAENDRAIGFYRRQGFSFVGERPFRVGETVYNDPVLALTL